MITFSPTIQALVSNGVFSTEVLIKIGDNRFETTSQTNITLSNGDTYIKNSTLKEASPPQLSQAVDSSEYTISFSDSSLEQGTTAEDLQNTLVEIRYIFYDTVNNVFKTDVNDTILIYKGRVNSAKYQIDSDEIGETVFQLVCGSPMSNLEMIKSMYSSKNFMRDNIRADDACFDQVYEGSGAVSLKWGKK